MFYAKIIQWISVLFSPKTHPGTLIGKRSVLILALTYNMKPQYSCFNIDGVQIQVNKSKINHLMMAS